MILNLPIVLLIELIENSALRQELKTKLKSDPLIAENTIRTQFLSRMETKSFETMQEEEASS